ncbi:uncharacterized protein LOC123504644 isoform X3 [Portunus trituberculatus]|uniref:uncharacterized protein LOC123504644 isoform X3 n=1 Tax=Portunus trituberculatus TaxID=210409 RepID=UPI001E1D009C|nr:uncharacterized protein LOC123504644 isoform X3 [Portunus trituberculatus]
MEEVSDFEGFTIEDCLFSMRFKRNSEEMLKRNCVSHHSSITEMRRGRPNNHTIKRETCTDIRKFWQIKEQYTFDTPHTVCDHGSWFEKITADLCNDIHQKLELNYKCYKKVVNLESCANITMFLNDCSEITTQRLWEHLVQQIKGRFTKSWLELTLIISPLFFFDDIHKVWKRKGISNCEGKKEIYPFIHWLGVLDQRKAWADLGSPEQNAELRMETIKAILLKQSLLTVEDIAKIISSTFRVPQCQQLTEMVLLTLTSCKIFYKSQDQEDGVANSVHLQQVAPRLNETKRISKPSQHYRRAARTAALYEELMLDGNTSEPPIDLEMKNFWLKSKCASTQNSFCEEPVERERESCLMCEKHEETESNFFHNQAYLLTKGGMLKEELRQDSDIVQCSMSKSHKLNNHRQFMNKRYKHTLKVSSQDQAPKEDLTRKNICHKTTHNSEKDLFNDCHQYLQGEQGKNSCTNDNEHFTSDQMKVKNSQKCQPEEITDMEDSLSLYCSESEHDSMFLTDTSDDDFEREQSLLLMEDSNSEISQKNPLISFIPLVKRSRQCKDNEEYRCPLFARTSYYISTPSQTLKDALPNQLHLGSRHDTSPLMVVKKDGGLLTHLKKSDIHTQSKDTGAEFGNILNKEASKVYNTKIAISNRTNMFQQNSDTVKSTSSSIHSESMLPVSSKGSFISERFNKAKKGDDLPRYHPHELNVVPKRELLEVSEEHLLSQSQKNIETLRQNPLPQDSPKIQNLTKNLRMFRMSRNIQSSASMESSHLVNKSQNKGIREPSDSHQTLYMSKENAGDKQCISLPSQRDEIIKDASTKILSGQQYGPNEIDLKIESEELKQQNTHATVSPTEEHSYAMNISKKPVMKNNLNRQNAVKESLKQNELSRIFVIKDSEALGVAQQCEKQTVKNSPEACNVSQEHFTTRSSDQLFAGTSAVKQQTNEGSTTPLKRQRWKSFKLRDDYEEIAYQMKVKMVKKPKTQPFVEETMQKVKKPKSQPFDEETMQKVKKPNMEPFDEETLQKLKKPLLMGWIRELVQRKICSSSNKDVYYHTPEGKKLRSSVEVDRYLAMMGIMDLSRENFTFFRAELGFGKPLEVTRDAAVRDAKLKLKCLQHTSDNQGHTSSRIPKRRFPNDNTINSKSKVGKTSPIWTYFLMTDSGSPALMTWTTLWRQIQLKL